MTTLAQLRTNARSRADMPSTTFVTNAELNVWLNEGLAIVHDKLVAAYGGDYLESSASFTTDGSEYLDLPADFYKLQGIDLVSGGVTYTLQPFTSTERNVFANQEISTWPTLPRYKFSGADRIRFAPIPDSGLSGTLWYIPKSTTLSGDSDTVAFPNGWERYAVVYAAIQMLTKEESDTSALQALLMKWDSELKDMFENRDAGAARKTVDVYLANDWWP